MRFLRTRRTPCLRRTIGPRSSIDNVGNCCSGNSVKRGNRSLRLVCFNAEKDLLYLRIGKFRLRTVFPPRMTALCYLVRRIDCRVTQEEMSDVPARRIIASVQNVHAIRNGTNFKYPLNSMCQASLKHSRHRSGGGAVIGGIPSTLPFMARIRTTGRVEPSQEPCDRVNAVWLFDPQGHQGTPLTLLHRVPRAQRSPPRRPATVGERADSVRHGIASLTGDPSGPRPRRQRVGGCAYSTTVAPG